MSFLHDIMFGGRTPATVDGAMRANQGDAVARLLKGDSQPQRQPDAPPAMPPAGIEAFAEPTNLPMPAMRQPPAPVEDPIGEDVTADAAGAALQQFPASAPGMPVAGGEAARASVQPRPESPEQTNYQAFRERKRELMMRMAQKMMTGSPALRVQGLQLLYEVQKDYEEDAASAQKKQDAAAELARGEEFIESTTARDDDKTNARAMLKLGIKPENLPEILRMNDAGYKEQKERKDAMQKQILASGDDPYTQGVLKNAQAKAFKVIDDSYTATGTPSALTGWLPGTPAANLEKILSPIKAIIGFDRLDQMRKESQTGGALGSINTKELEFLQSTQGSLETSIKPADLKQNIATIVEAHGVFAQMRALAPAIDAGDPAALKKYRELSEKLGTIHETARERLDASRPPKQGAKKAPDGNWYVERP